MLVGNSEYMKLNSERLRHWLKVSKVCDRGQKCGCMWLRACICGKYMDVLAALYTVYVHVWCVCVCVCRERESVILKTSLTAVLPSALLVVQTSQVKLARWQYCCGGKGNMLSGRQRTHTHTRSQCAILHSIGKFVFSIMPVWCNLIANVMQFLMTTFFPVHRWKCAFSCFCCSSFVI